MGNREGKMFSAPAVINDDKRLNSREKLVLIILFSHTRPSDRSLTLKRLDKIASEASISQESVRNIIKRLVGYGWIVVKDRDGKGSEKRKTYLLEIPDLDSQHDNYNSIARVWGTCFGTRQLTPYMFKRIRSYMKKGIEEEVIVQVIKMYAEKIEGNPINYIISILQDYLERGILTLKDLAEEKQRVKDYGKQVQGNNKSEEKRTPREELEELYRQGYR